MEKSSRQTPGIEDYFNLIESVGIKFEERVKFKDWLIEYGLARVQKEGLNPAENSEKIGYYACEKIKKIWHSVEKNKSYTNPLRTLSTPSKKSIDSVLCNDLGKKCDPEYGADYEAEREKYFGKKQNLQKLIIKIISYKVSEDIESYFNEIKRHRGRFENENSFKSWLLELGYRTAEFKGNTTPKNVSRLMKVYLSEQLRIVKFAYTRNKSQKGISTPGYARIPEIIGGYFGLKGQELEDYILSENKKHADQLK